jgi:hypothetical protein
MFKGMNFVTDIKDLFTVARESVTAEQAARYYGVAVNSHHRAKCPFHGGEHYNLSFKGGGFHCFVCGLGGDSVRFAQELLQLASPMDALRQVDRDFGLGLPLGKSNNAPRIDKAKLNAAKRKALTGDLLTAATETLLDFAAALEFIQSECAPSKETFEEASDVWVFSLHNLEYAKCLADEFLMLSDAEKLKFIKEERGLLEDEERLNRRVERLRLARRKRKYRECARAGA